MRKILMHIIAVLALGMLSSCYGYRQVGLLQERDDLPQYDSAAYEPYRLQVNDEIIYRVVTMDEPLRRHYLRTTMVQVSMLIHIEFILMVR